MLRWMRTRLFNDSACYSCHHLASADASGGRGLLMAHTAQERHVVGVVSAATSYGASPGYNVASWSVNNGVLLVRNWDSVFIFVLTRKLLRALAIQSGGLVGLRRVFDELCHADALLWTLAVDNTGIHVWLPVFSLRRLLLHDWRLWLSCLLFLLQSFIATAIGLRTEPVIVRQKLILSLLHVIPTTSVNTLPIVIVLHGIFIGVIGAVPLLWHALLIVVICYYDIVSLLFHLLVQFVECRTLLQGILLLLHLLLQRYLGGRLVLIHNLGSIVCGRWTIRETWTRIRSSLCQSAVIIVLHLWKGTLSSSYRAVILVIWLLVCLDNNIFLSLIVSSTSHIIKTLVLLLQLLLLIHHAVGVWNHWANVILV